MRWFLCLCVFLSCLSTTFASLVSVSESDSIHANLISQSLHSNRVRIASAAYQRARSFHSMAAPPPGLSQACITASADIDTNPQIIAANKTLTHAGCTDLNLDDNSGQCSSTKNELTKTISITCNCVGSFPNRDSIQAIVAAQNATMCTIDIGVSMSFIIRNPANGQTGTANMAIKYQVPKMEYIPLACTPQDLNIAVSSGIDQGVQVFRPIVLSTARGIESALDNQVQVTDTTYTITESMCGVYSASKTATVNGSIQHMVSWAILGITMVVSYVFMS